ncbi:MAG: class I SAM-dependent methyltransferase [Gammaproteobacteria bacterium]|nr:class I SAM-dependent methyltransferase [Gammaproteobacteria bacterium]
MCAARTSRTTSRKASGQTLAAKADRHRLYENSVQDADAELDFVEREFRQLRGRNARYLREDFCGTASVATAWVRRHRQNRAVGVDLDPEVLAWGRTQHVNALPRGERGRVTLLNENVLQAVTPPQDVILAMNFSYWIFKTRDALRDYFKATLAALGEDGVFLLDCFGGYDAFRVLKERRELKGFTYVWDQASYNPVTGDLRCHIHYEFPDRSLLRKAFTYDWRLWTLPEIREVLAEAGFARTVVYWQGWDDEADEGDGDYQPVESADADAGWIAYLAALR